MSIATISHTKFLKLDKDHQQSASAAALVYSTDITPGISRIKHGKGFSYRLNDKALTESKAIEHIRKLAIPPSWDRVWINPLTNGHIQATGYDLRQRKQYRYHTGWHHLRNETKFHRMLEFGKALPALRLKMKHDLAINELSEENVIATVIALMEQTYIRIGNNDYEKQNGSYGITTLKDRHISITGDKINFRFQGKKGVAHNVSIRNKRLAKTIKACRDLPGKNLFQYLDAERNIKTIDSGMVNNYIRSAAGSDFSAKDLRTWAGSLNVLQILMAMEKDDDDPDRRKNSITALDLVSQKLGNSRSICKKYYVHPGLFQLYEEDKLKKYLTAHKKPGHKNKPPDLHSNEWVLLQILQSLL